MSRGLAAFLLIFSSFCFSLSTVFAKFAHNASQILSPFQVSLYRFLFGAVFMAAFIGVRKKSPRPRRPDLVLWRGLLNTGAVLTLYLALKHTTVTKTNMLNWTFPVFVFLFSPWVNREKPGPLKYLFLGLSMAGMGLLISPDFSTVNWGDISGLASGVLGGAAVSVLRECRKHDDSYVILFYLMLIGLVINGVVAFPFLIFGGLRVQALMIAAAICGFLGQITITTPSKHFEASTGSILMASGILFSGLFGALFFGDPLTGKIVAGGLLIMISLVGVSGALEERWGRRTGRLSGERPGEKAGDGPA